MHHSVQAIQDRGIPTNSYVSAVGYVMEQPELDQSQYQNAINDIVGSETETIKDPRQTKYTYLYLIQETLRNTDSTDCFDAVGVYTLAYKRAEEYIAQNSWVFAEPEDAEPKLDATGKPKRKKGAKQEEAARIYTENKEAGKQAIVDLFMSELDMSKAGATTYFYNMRKKLGE